MARIGYGKKFKSLKRHPQIRVKACQGQQPDHARNKQFVLRPVPCSPLSPHRLGRRLLAYPASLPGRLVCDTPYRVSLN
jgi:hypothetical protein